MRFLNHRLLRSPWFIALSALGIRISLVLYYCLTTGYRLSMGWTSGIEEVVLGQHLAAGQGFSSPFGVPTGPTAMVPPGYPAVLSVIFRLFGPVTDTSALATVGLNLLVSAATTIPIFFFARKTLGEGVAALAAWIWATYRLVILFAGFHVWDGTVAVLFAATAFWVSTELTERDWKPWALFGALWGIGALVNPVLLALCAVALLYACWLLLRRRAAWFRNAEVAALVLAAVLAPWTARNYRAFHRLMPLRDNFGLELWMGNHPGADGFFHFELHPLGSPIELQIFKIRGETSYVQMKQQQAMAFIKGHPREFSRLTCARIVCFWCGVYDSGFSPGAIPTALFGLIGLTLLAFRKRVEAWRFFWPLLIVPIPYYITHADVRFRFPLEPLLMPLSGYAIITLITELRARAAKNALSPDRAAEAVTVK